eukprot:6033561-Amphidinium_carterae.1
MGFRWGFYGNCVAIESSSSITCHAIKSNGTYNTQARRSTYAVLIGSHTQNAGAIVVVVRACLKF